MKVGFVCTNYNNSSLTRAAVASLCTGTKPDDVRVVVVDNESQESDVASLRDVAGEFAGVDLVLNPRNVGYFAGLNIGIRRMREMHPDVTHIVVGNNDLVFPPDFIERVRSHRDVFERWAVVAPDLVTLDGVHQNPHVLYPLGRIRKLIWDAYYLSYGMAAVVKQLARIARPLTVRKENVPGTDLYKRPGPIEQGYGACYLLGPCFFRHFGRLFAPTFMMQEEFFLYEQLRSIGQLTYYDPRFVVGHHGHATVDQMPSRSRWKISRDAHRVYKNYLALSPAERLRMIEAGSESRHDPATGAVPQ